MTCFCVLGLIKKKIKLVTYFAFKQNAFPKRISFVDSLSLNRSKMETQKYSKMIKLFDIVKIVEGFGDLIEKRKIKAQMCYLAFLMLNAVICILNSATSFVEFISNDLVRAIMVGFIGFVSVSAIFFKYLVAKQRNSFQSLLEWCKKLHTEEFLIENESIHDILDDCYVRALKVFTEVAIIFPIFINVGYLFDLLLLYFINGEWTPLIPSLLFWSREDTLLNRIVATVNQLLFISDVFLGACLIFGTMFAAVEYFLAIMSAMKLALDRLETPSSPQNYKNAIQLLANFHAELIEQQGIMSNLAMWPIFFFETNMYGIALVIWTISYFDRTQALIAGTNAGLVIPYIAISYLNEKLADGYDDLRAALYEFDWYNLKPRQRTMLLNIMVMVDRPILLKSGYFHFVNFDELRNFANRVYNYGLFINSMVEV